MQFQYKTLNMLFLCTGNSARSIIAESILNALAQKRFKAYSAGSRPTGEVNPMALEILRRRSVSTQGLRSKSWDEFAQPHAPVMDFVFTVCDAAAGEACPLWPGSPIRAHWGLPDPAAVQGTEAEREAAFRATYDLMRRRIVAFMDLPLQTLGPKEVEVAVRRIGIG